MGYSKDVIKGFSWGTFLDLASKGSAFLKMAIVYRILNPEQVGVFGIGLLILGMLELITETGINVFLIQEDKGVKDYLDSAWAVSIARGVLISLLLLILAYPISLFFRSPTAFNFILAMALVPFLRGFINPAIINLQKGLKFRQDAMFRFIVTLVEDGAIVVFAILTASVFSFVWGIVVGVLVEVLLTFILVKEKPKFAFNKVHFKLIVNRGKWVTIALVFDYLFEHTDDLAIGRILDVASLGIYQSAYALSIVPLKSIAQQLGRVTFPVYTKMLGEGERLKRAFIKTFWTTTVIVCLLGAFFFVFSEPVIRIVLGETWLSAIPVLRVLAIFGVVRAMVNLFQPLFLAYKKQEYVTMVTLVSIVVLAILVVPMTLQFGVVGAAISALIGAIAGLFPSVYFFKKIFNE